MEEVIMSGFNEGTEWRRPTSSPIAVVDKDKAVTKQQHNKTPDDTTAANQQLNSKPDDKTAAKQ